MSCWVVLRYLVSLFVKPGCNVARTFPFTPSLGLPLDGGYCNKKNRSCNKVLLANKKASSKSDYSEAGRPESLVVGTNFRRPFPSAVLRGKVEDVERKSRH